MNKYFTYWQEEIKKEDVLRWLGNPEAEYKTYTIDYLEEKKYSSLIDCGAGVFTLHDSLKKRRLEIKYVATEVTKNFVELGIEKGIEAIHCPVQDITVSDNYCEVSVCLAVLNHQLEFETCMKELIRIAEKEIIISFFKPFIEEKRAWIEIQNCIDKFPIVSNNPNIGVTIERNEKFVYTFFSRKAIEKFLNTLNVKYFFHTLEDRTEMLHIIKDWRDK